MKREAHYNMNTHALTHMIMAVYNNRRRERLTNTCTDMGSK